MRVLQLGKYYDPYMGGIETHLSLLCAELRAQDEVEVLVCNTGRRTERGEVKGIQVTRAGAWARAFSTDLCPALVAEISGRKFDVLHLHTPNPMPLANWCSSGMLCARKISTELSLGSACHQPPYAPGQLTVATPPRPLKGSALSESITTATPMP